MVDLSSTTTNRINTSGNTFTAINDSFLKDAVTTRASFPGAISSPTPNNFSVRGAANNRGASSGPTALSQSIHAQAVATSGKAAAATGTGLFSGYGHYSAGGVPAYPGVLGGGLPGVDFRALGGGSQRRTPGSWTWTAGRS